MQGSELITAASGAAALFAGRGILQELYGDTLKPTLVRLGSSLAAVLDLAPLLLLKLRSPVVRELMMRHLNHVADRIASDDDSEPAVVPPEIGVEILDRLSTVTDADIAEYYYNLLSKASIKRTSAAAHPRFVSVIAAISPDEARLLNYMADTPLLPFSDAVFTPESDPESVFDLQRFMTIIPSDRLKLTFAANLPEYWENLCSLGLFEARRDSRVSADTFYDEIEAQNKPALDAFAKIPAISVKLRYGFLRTTEFGKKFMEVCSSPEEPKMPMVKQAGRTRPNDAK